MKIRNPLYASTASGRIGNLYYHSTHADHNRITYRPRQETKTAATPTPQQLQIRDANTRYKTAGALRAAHYQQFIKLAIRQQNRSIATVDKTCTAAITSPGTINIASPAITTP